MGGVVDRSASSNLPTTKASNTTSMDTKHKICKDDIVLSVGSDVNTSDSFCNTLVIQATSEGNKTRLDDLIKGGANVNLSGDNGQTALFVAAWRDYAEFVDSLIQAGADVNHRDVYRRTPLMFASRNSHIRCVKRLLKAGADVNAIATGHETALFYAAKNGHFACIELLMRSGAAVNTPAKNDSTALFHAATKGYSKCVELLLCQGAEVNVSDRSGNTALFLAAKNSHVKCVQLLVEAGADLNRAFMEAAWKANNSSFEMLVNAATRIPGVVLQCRQTMIYAAESGHVKYLKQLTDVGAGVNVRDSHGNTPLIRASLNGHSQCVEFLIQQGADVNHANHMGNTALIAASYSVNNVNVVKILLSAGACVNVRNKRSRRAVSTCADDYVYGNNVPTLLFAAGELYVNKTFKFNAVDDEKLCLMNACRFTIRKQLIHANRHTNLFMNVPQLGLPKMLSAYLLYNMTLNGQ